ncbi:MAG: hypothetical protein ACRC11_08090 [Xenococcaceae cyanobacterium]
MNVKQQLEESMLLWLPDYLCDEDDSESIESVTQANGAIIDFIDGDLSLSEMVERIEYYGANPDDYLTSFEEDLRLFGA